MSDKKNINIQDRGWSDMHSILDKEMPVKKKKRRPIVWFFFGGATIMVIALATLFMLPSIISDSKIAGIEKSNEIEENSTLNINPISQNEVEDKKESNSIDEIEHQKQRDNKTSQSLQQTLKTKKQTKNLAREIKTDNSSNIDLIPKSNKSIFNQKEQFLNNVEQGSNIKRHAKEIEKSDNNTDESTIDEGVDYIRNYNTSEKIEPIESTKENETPRSLLIPSIRLPLFTPLIIDNKASKAEEDMPKIALLGSKSLISPYVFASAMRRPNLNRSGYGFGVGLNIKRSSIDYYVEAGYFKSTYNNPTGTLLYDNDPSAIPQEEIEGSDIGFISPNISSYAGNNRQLSISNFSKITRSTDELSLNLGIRKQIFNNLKFDAGMSFAFLLSASNKSFLLNINSPSKVGDNLFYRVNTSELHNSGAYASIDFVPHVGLEYTIFSNVHLGINYNYGLKNLISNTETDRYKSENTEDERIFRRNLSAKIRYQF